MKRTRNTLSARAAGGVSRRDARVASNGTVVSLRRRAFHRAQSWKKSGRYNTVTTHRVDELVQALAFLDLSLRVGDFIS